MRATILLLAGSLAVSMTALAGTVLADTGVGVCVAGQGTSFYTPSVDAGYVGVNAGTRSDTGAFTDRAAFETECCAEVGEEPDCFAPVA